MKAWLLGSVLMLTLVTVPAIAQDQGTGAAGQGDTGQSPAQATPLPQVQMPQAPADQNTIRNSPLDQYLRTQQAPGGRVQEGMALPGEETQFQQYILQSSGQYLPVFGTNFFAKVPSTFAPVDQVPVTADYVIGPGDEVVIRAWGQVDIDYRDTVDRNGNVYVPKVGALHVIGLRYDQLHDFISTAVSRIFRNFQLSVSLGSLRSIHVFVVGYASRPGGYTISSMSTLVNAIFTAGGPAPNGSMRHILLRRGSQVVADFDLYDLLLEGDKSKDQQLLPGDVIYFAPVGPQVALYGSVNQPAIYELAGKTTLGGMLKLAGGLSPIATETKAYVERISDHKVREVVSLPLTGDGLERELYDGDLINVAPVSARFNNAVTLRGNVATPGRHPWHQGMRVKDLVPDLYSLITERYWIQQNDITRSAQWGLSSTDQTCLPGGPNANLPACMYGQPSRGMLRKRPSGTQQFPSPQYPYPQYPYPQQSPNLVPYGTPGQYSPAYPQQQGASAYPQPGQYPSQNPAFPQIGAPNSNTATLAGAQQLESGAQAALKLEIQRVAPEVNWNYALIERLNLEDLSTRLIPFNLRRALLDPDSEDNLELKPGDVVTIFSQDDMRVPVAQQSKYVYLEGEVKTPGVYKAEPGETLRDLVERVGGLTQNAYLFGAEFTRDSARNEQQLRLDQATRQFEQEIERNSAEQATTNISNITGTQEAASFQANLQSQRQLINRLKEVRADGRVVLGIRPTDDTVSALPAIPLDDGDRLVVPSRPSYVNVVGAVYNTSSYIYGKNLRVRDYLREAGGGTRVADPKRTFVVRADGSVVRQVSGAFTGSLMAARLMPGDTVVVPQQLNKPGFMKGLKDWSQVLGQIGLAAAAVNVLK